MHRRIDVTFRRGLKLVLASAFAIHLPGAWGARILSGSENPSGATGAQTEASRLTNTKGPVSSEPLNRADSSKTSPTNDLSKTRPQGTSSLSADIPKTTSEEEYRIGDGDVLHISVWKEPDVSVPSIVVRPDGKITLPLLKDIEVAGLTPGEAEKNIAAGLSAFITDANVTVIVTDINSKKIYVIGAVKKEGPLAYTYKMTVMQALTESGGLTDYAKRKKIYILRAESGKEIKIPFNYDAILNGKYVEHIWLQPNDTLVVPH